MLNALLFPAVTVAAMMPTATTATVVTTAMVVPGLAGTTEPAGATAATAVEPGAPAGEAPADTLAMGRSLQRRSYDAVRTPDAPVIDGSLDEDAWTRASWSRGFVDIVGAQGPVPRHRTRMKLLWDERHLYVAAELEEPDLWATLTEHDAIVWRDDDFEVFVDPDGDGLSYYEIEINALGTILDLYLARPYDEGGKAELDWNVEGLVSAVRLDGTLNDPDDRDRGWRVEMAVPWVALVPSDRGGEEGPVDAEPTSPPAPPSPGDEWRMNFSRVDWPLDVVEGAYRKAREPGPDDPHPEENWVWSPQGEVNMHIPERWGVVRFVEAGES